MTALSGKIDIDKSFEAIANFFGVEHRLEFVREINGVKWYNDSVSSSPTRTIAGLNSYDEEIVLIAGGYDKNLDYTPIAKPILDKVKKLILFVSFFILEVLIPRYILIIITIININTIKSSLFKSNILII